MITPLVSFKDFDPSYETGTKGDSMNKKIIKKFVVENGCEADKIN